MTLSDITHSLLRITRPVKDTLHFFIDELNAVIHDGGVLIFIAFVPLAYPLLYAYIYTNEAVRSIPVAVVDESHSKESRQFARLLDAMPEVEVIAHCATPEEAKPFLMSRHAFGVVRIPREFGRRIYAGDQAIVGLYCDMSSMLYYKNVLLATKNVSLQMNRDIKVEKYLPSSTREAEKINKMPVDYAYIPLFNKQSGFAAFLIPPVLMLIIQQTLLLGVGMACGRHRERARLLLPDGSPAPMPQPKRTWEQAAASVMGRGMFYFILYMIWAIYMYCYITRLFSLPQQTTFLRFLGFITPYLLACIMFALTLGQFVYRREDSIVLFVCLSVPMVFLTGISWPLYAMPKFWEYFAYLFPCRFGMHGYMKLSVMGATLPQIAFEYHALWIQAGVFFLTACVLARRKGAA